MHKVISVFCLLSIAASLMAAPTANEDFVVAEDAKTYTNAVNDANAYTDGKIGAIDVGVTSVNGSTGDVTLVAADVLTPMQISDISQIGQKADERAWIFSSENDDGRPALDGVTPEVSWENGRWYISGLANGYYQMMPSSGSEDAKMMIFLVTDENVNARGLIKASFAKVLRVGEIDVGVTSVNGSTGAVTLVAADVGAVPTSRKVNGQPLTSDIIIAGGVTSVNGSTGDVTIAAADVGAVPTSRKVNGKALTGDVTLGASDVGAFGAAAGASLQTQVTTIGAHLNAEDARFVVTNYNSVAHTPEAYVEIKLPDNSWSRIWSEMTRWDWLTGTYLPGNFYTQTAIDTKLAEKADRAWGFYDSTTGAFAPDDYTWISSPKIAIAANLAYQRTVTAEGAIWVLESNGTVTETGGMTNGFFRISDDEGNSLFAIVKGNKRTVGADAASCQTVAGFTPTKLQIGYSIVSDVHPTIYVCTSLSTQAWKAEDDADCVANVSWSGASGAWVAQVQGKGAYSSLYVKATYEVGGETYISNSAPVSMQYLMLNGVKYAVGTATISGHTVLTLTVAP